MNVVNRDTNQRVPITSGNMVVTNIYHWDEVLNSTEHFDSVVHVLSIHRLHMRSTSRPPKKTLQENDTCTRCPLSKFKLNK